MIWYDNVSSFKIFIVFFLKTLLLESCDCLKVLLFPVKAVAAPNLRGSEKCGKHMRLFK